MRIIPQTQRNETKGVQDKLPEGWKRKQHFLWKPVFMTYLAIHLTLFITLTPEYRQEISPSPPHPLSFFLLWLHYWLKFWAELKMMIRTITPFSCIQTSNLSLCRSTSLHWLQQWTVLPTSHLDYYGQIALSVCNKENTDAEHVTLHWCGMIYITINREQLMVMLLVSGNSRFSVFMIVNYYSSPYRARNLGGQVNLIY